MTANTARVSRDEIPDVVAMSSIETQSPPRYAERGATSVDDGELEVGSDEVFERRWSHFGQVFRFVMIAFVAAALGGFLGHGPFSHATARAATGLPSVDYEPIARYGTPTTLTFHVANTSAMAHALTIALNFKAVQPLGLQRMNPLPIATEAKQDGLALTFDVSARQPNASIQLVAQPSAIGWVHLAARVGDSDLSWDQFIVP